MKAEGMEGIGGWQAPTESFDYGKMEQEALAECAAIKRKLDALKAAKPRTAEEELARRHDVCMLTDIYYEQRHQARLFHSRLLAKEEKI